MNGSVGVGIGKDGGGGKVLEEWGVEGYGRVEVGEGWVGGDGGSV